MNIVDSSGWLEYFADTKRAKYFAEAIEATDDLIIPAIIFYEVFKKILLERDEAVALQAVAHMRLGKTVELNLELALSAARLSKQHRLPMADSIIFATAQQTNAIVWTQDADFADLPGVNYFRKP